MSTTPHPPFADDDLPPALRLQLRGLRFESRPGHDLWPGIAARIAAAQPRPDPVAPGQPPRLLAAAWTATAASVALALGIGWQLRTASLEPISPVPATHAPLLLLQADAMAREYEAALREVEVARPAAVRDQDALGLLDRSAAEVRHALARDPDARFLLEQLQRIYSQRLALTRRLS